MKHMNYVVSIFSCVVNQLVLSAAKELSSEVGRLQILLSQKNDANDGTLIRSPNITPGARSKKAFTVSPEKKTPNSCSNKGGSQQEVVAAHYNCQEKHNMVSVDCSTTCY